MNTPSQQSFLNRIRMIRILTVLVIGLFGATISIPVMTITMVNERKDIREQVRQTQIAISDMEVQYFELAQSIDPETIKQLGFTESITPVFAYTKENYPAVALSR
jgi:hypothetical protein